MHLACAAAKSCCWRSPSHVSLPRSLGVFQVWLPSTSSGEPVAHPVSAGLSSGSAPLHTRPSPRIFPLSCHSVQRNGRAVRSPQIRYLTSAFFE